jgi:hypothetical protein
MVGVLLHDGYESVCFPVDKVDLLVVGRGRTRDRTKDERDCE